MKRYKTLEQLFEDFKPDYKQRGGTSGITEIARLIKSNYRAVFNWRRFKHIPEKYWGRLSKIGVCEADIAVINKGLKL